MKEGAHVTSPTSPPAATKRGSTRGCSCFGAVVGLVGLPTSGRSLFERFAGADRTKIRLPPSSFPGIRRIIHSIQWVSPDVVAFAS